MKLKEMKYKETFQEVKTVVNISNIKTALTTNIWTSVATEAC